MRRVPFPKRQSRKPNLPAPRKFTAPVVGDSEGAALVGRGPGVPRHSLAGEECSGSVAGVDEAGRGPWAGPVVAAAVILPARLAMLEVGGSRRPLRVRIDDSKRLSARQRALAYQAILAHAIVGVGIVPADSIDADNIRQATLQAMVKAVADLAIQPELVLVDGCDAPPVNLPCRPIIGGDRSSYPIACASIIAKVTRDRLMEFYHRLFPAYRFDQHKGYGTSLHHHALTQHGPSFLHRLTFAPVAAVSHRSGDPYAFRQAAARTRR